MKPQNKRPRKKVSFANTAMVLDFQKEDPTEKIQWNVNAQTEAVLTGSYIYESPNEAQIPSPHTRQHHAYSITSVDSHGDDAFLSNTFASPQNTNTNANPPFRASPPNHNHYHHCNPSQTPMDIEHDDEDSDNEMELTGNYGQSLSNNTPQIEDLNDLYNSNDDDEDMDNNPLPPTTPNADITTNNHMESLQDLFNADNHTLSSIPEVPDIRVNAENVSFDTETKHLQTPENDTRQSINAFNANLSDNNNNTEPMMIDNDNDNDNDDGDHVNNGSFSDNETKNDNTMPALESPTTTMNMNTPFVDNDEDHTLRIQLPQHLLGTPLTHKQTQACRDKRPSCTNLTEHIMPRTALNISPNINVNTSLLSDTMNLGSVTKSFRSKVNVNNGESVDNAVVTVNAEDNDNDGDTSFNTRLANCNELLHEQYGLIQQNDTINTIEIRNVAPDLSEIRNEQQQDEYTMRLNDDIQLKWRDIASKYEWYPEIKTKKFSLGLGITEQRIDTVFHDRKDIILQEICDKIEHDEWRTFSENINAENAQIDAEIKDLEKTMDEIYVNDDVITKQNIEKYGMNENEYTQKVSEYLKLKNQSKFDEYKLKCLMNVNGKMSENYDHLCDDLEKLKQIYNDLDNECVTVQQNIHKLKGFETNQELMNVQKKIFENDKQIEIEENRCTKWNELLQIERSKTLDLEQEISLKSERLKHWKEMIETACKYEEECDEIAECIWFLFCVSGIKLNQMTSTRIELLLMRWVSFCMEYDVKTQKVYNIRFTKHKSPKYTDDFSKYLINMCHQIGNTLKLSSEIQSISDLKRVIWDIIELITGIGEIRRNVNLIQKVNDANYRVIITPLKEEMNTKPNEINIEICMKRTVAHNDNENMRSSLLMTSVYNIKMGYPNNRMNPKVCAVLIRKRYNENTKKYKSIRDRIPQMMLEQKICESIEHKLCTIPLGRDLLIRCVNLIKFEMDEILEKEANYKLQSNT